MTGFRNSMYGFQNTTEGLNPLEEIPNSGRKICFNDLCGFEVVSTLSKNSFAIFSWVVVEGSKGCIWEVSDAILEVIASAWAFRSTMRTVQALCGLLWSLHGCWHLCVDWCRHYPRWFNLCVDYCVPCVGYYILYMGYCILCVGHHNICVDCLNLSVGCCGRYLGFSGSMQAVKTSVWAVAASIRAIKVTVWPVAACVWALKAFKQAVHPPCRLLSKSKILDSATIQAFQGEAKKRKKLKKEKNSLPNFRDTFIMFPKQFTRFPKYGKRLGKVSKMASQWFHGRLRHIRNGSFGQVLCLVFCSHYGDYCSRLMDYPSLHVATQALCGLL